MAEEKMEDELVETDVEMEEELPPETDEEMPAEMAGEMPEEMPEEMAEEGEGEMVDFASPTEALAAAIEEHGADPEALMAWFDQYGYELVKTGGEEGMAEEGAPEGPLDLVGLRTSVVEKLGPMLGGKA
tara:strand:+ start:7080 stop:7466 length:387 start_codon:yes stop_codon:yes gene_type:complete